MMKNDTIKEICDLTAKKFDFVLFLAKEFKFKKVDIKVIQEAKASKITEKEGKVQDLKKKEDVIEGSHPRSSIFS